MHPYVRIGVWEHVLCVLVSVPLCPPSTLCDACLLGSR